MKPDEGYPKAISNWDDRLTHVDAATAYENKTTFFFSDGQIFVFSDIEMKVPVILPWLSSIFNSISVIYLHVA